MAKDELDDLVTLIERLLDERVTGQRADDIQARDVRFVCSRHSRDGGGIVVGKFDAAGFDEFARRYGAEAGDETIAGHMRFAIGRAQHGDHRLLGARRFLHAGNLGAVVALDFAVFDALQDQIEIAFLDTVELVLAVDDDDRVLLGERHGVLDAGIARAHHDDGLALVFLGIIELVLDTRQIFARHAELADVALQADGQHYGVGLNCLAVAQAQIETVRSGRDAGHFGLITGIDVMELDTLVPQLQHRLAVGGHELERRAQRQHRRLGHHELALLVTEDGVGDLPGGFEQQMRNAEFRGMGGRAQARRPGTHYGNLISFRHAVSLLCRSF